MGTYWCTCAAFLRLYITCSLDDTSCVVGAGLVDSHEVRTSSRPAANLLQDVSNQDPNQERLKAQNKDQIQEMQECKSSTQSSVSKRGDPQIKNGQGRPFARPPCYPCLPACCLCLLLLLSCWQPSRATTNVDYDIMVHNTGPLSGPLINVNSSVPPWMWGLPIPETVRAEDDFKFLGGFTLGSQGSWSVFKHVDWTCLFSPLRVCVEGLVVAANLLFAQGNPSNEPCLQLCWLGFLGGVSLFIPVGIPIREDVDCQEPQKLQAASWEWIAQGLALAGCMFCLFWAAAHVETALFPIVCG